MLLYIDLWFVFGKDYMFRMYGFSELSRDNLTYKDKSFRVGYCAHLAEESECPLSHMWHAKGIACWRLVVQNNL